LKIDFDLYRLKYYQTQAKLNQSSMLNRETLYDKLSSNLNNHLDVNQKIYEANFGLIEVIYYGSKEIRQWYRISMPGNGNLQLRL